MKKKDKIPTIAEMPAYLSSQERGDLLTQLIMIVRDIPDAAYQIPALEYSRLAMRIVTPTEVKLMAIISLAALGKGLPGDAWRQGYLLELEKSAQAKAKEREQSDGTGDEAGTGPAGGSLTDRSDGPLSNGG